MAAIESPNADWLRTASAEVPFGLSKLCDTFNMQFDTLLGQLLRDFEVTWESPDATTLPQTRIVHAVRKPEQPRGSVQEARLEIDVEKGGLPWYPVSSTMTESDRA